MNFTSLFIKMARNIHKGNNLHSCFCFFGKNTTPLKMRDHLREMRDHRSINLSKNIKKLNWLKSNRVKGRNRASFETGRAPIQSKSSSICSQTDWQHVGTGHSKFRGIWFQSNRRKFVLDRWTAVVRDSTWFESFRFVIWLEKRAFCRDVWSNVYNLWVYMVKLNASNNCFPVPLR